MIRMILLGLGFVGLSAGLVVFLNAEGDSAGPVRAEVTRDQTDVGGLTAVTPSDLGDLVQAAQDTPATGDAAALSQGVLASLGTRPAPAPSRQNPADALAALVREAQDARTLTKDASKDDAAIAALTRSVLANIDRGLKHDDDAPSLERLVSQAMREGQSDAYLDALLNEARNTGDIVIPQELITSDDRIDTATLLATLVQRSVATTGVPEQFKSVEKTVTATPEPAPVAAGQSHKVQPGDSLAAIAYRYYGQTYLYLAIFEANRDKLATPDQIKVGQTLTIPVL